MCVCEFIISTKVVDVLSRRNAKCERKVNVIIVLLAASPLFYHHQVLLL